MTGAAVASGAIALSLFSVVPVAAAPAAPTPAADDLASRFTLAVIPDTQFYSRYSADQFMPRYGSDPFAVQTDWLAENADALNIPFAAHLGDVVDQVGQAAEWEAADGAMQTLDDAKLPYSILPGNHDVRNSDDNLDDTGYDLADEPFLDWFGPDRAAGVATYEGSDPTGLSQYHVFEAEGQRYLVLALTWRASDATIAWADSVIKANPTLPVILTTHQIIDIEPDGVTPKETEYGLELWDKLIRGNDQIFLTLNGHFHGQSLLTKTNDFGHTVSEVVIDLQMAYEGGNGYLGLFEFDLTNGGIHVQTASPWVTWKPQETLTSYDQAFLEAPNQQFDIDIDFADRFAAFAPAFAAGDPTRTSLSAKARDILLEGFTGPDPVSTEAPGSAADYPLVDGTLAHWRFDGLSGVVGEGQTIEDIAGGNDLTRASIVDSGSATAEVGDVAIVADHAYLSSDTAVSCFTNSDNAGRFSYLSTSAEAPLNDESFDAGYTIETFLKIDPAWTASDNQWMMALIRTGNRNEMPGVPYDRWGNGGPAVLGLSNLKEFQWSVIPNQPELGDRVNWSGEIQVDTWMHVAIVNDPTDRTTTMYVNGAPVLRNASDAVGQSFVPDAPWLMGAGMNDNVVGSGWKGCIGETRIVDHPIPQSSWLTSRADLTGLAISAAPSGALDSAARVAAFSGTGLAGAEVRISGDITGSTTVGANGEWTVTLPSILAAGDYRAEVVQALGSRASAASVLDFSIAAAVVTPGQTPGVDLPADGENAGAGLPARGRGTLANTGGSLPTEAGVAAALVVLFGVAGVLFARRRSAAKQTPAARE
ncbi:LamG-like jellyroll fold domain-containing protein [Conyzicola sp.]|uniref:LamG-like jellyroll fold domain-containing protein n=1 Tax=Conyzicola sp. TaxID=1969404 RepID=UPI003989C3D2